jgi:hypothetical protein
VVGPFIAWLWQALASNYDQHARSKVGDGQKEKEFPQPVKGVRRGFVTGIKEDHWGRLAAQFFKKDCCTLVSLSALLGQVGSRQIDSLVNLGMAQANIAADVGIYPDWTHLC